eukprot:Hpha_TRINITY_DN22594_c0_g1::TRINITY_DN22594_c0_g1_i1::g.185056::m.185056
MPRERAQSPAPGSPRNGLQDEDDLHRHNLATIGLLLFVLWGTLTVMYSIYIYYGDLAAYGVLLVIAQLANFGAWILFYAYLDKSGDLCTGARWFWEALFPPGPLFSFLSWRAATIAVYLTLIAVLVFVIRVLKYGSLEDELWLFFCQRLSTAANMWRNVLFFTLLPDTWQSCLFTCCCKCCVKEIKPGDIVTFSRGGLQLQGLVLREYEYGGEDGHEYADFQGCWWVWVTEGEATGKWFVVNEEDFKVNMDMRGKGMRRACRDEQKRLNRLREEKRHEEENPLDDSYGNYPPGNYGLVGSPRGKAANRTSGGGRGYTQPGRILLDGPLNDTQREYTDARE